MRFLISTQELTFLINKCLNVVAAKATLPILSNLLIEAINDELTITATDLTVGVRCYTEAKILEEGATTLPAKRLFQLIKELTAANLEISSNANEVTEIIADSSRFKLHGMNRNEFPSLPSLTGATELRMKQSDLREMLFRTAFAVSREDNRYVLTGVYFQIINGEATFIGTDGKRLARTRLSLDGDRTLNGNYIIPLKAVEEIMKNLTDDGEATLFLMADKIAVKMDQQIIISKLLSGDYPDVNRVIPERSELSVTLHREELMTLLRQISLFTGESNHSVRFAFSDGELQLTANTSEVGEGRVSMPVNYQGQKLDIAFNPNFFLDILRHTKAETVSMEMTDAYNPGVIKDAKATYVLMPMRLHEV